jgi:hypothetical protein
VFIVDDSSCPEKYQVTTENSNDKKIFLNVHKRQKYFKMYTNVKNILNVHKRTGHFVQTTPPD